jgi:tetratricopeptide (TPR) repeat protein
MTKEPQYQSKLPFPQKLILVICGIFLSIVLLEIGLRLGGFIFLSLQEYRNRTAIYKKGTYRIMCLGESTTAGGRESYPSQLEEILNQRNLGINFSVINKGAVAVNSIAIISQIEENLKQYRPDMVTAMMGDNDRYIKYYESIPEANTFLFNRFRTYRLARLLWMHILNKIKKKGIYALQGNKTASRLQPNYSLIGLKACYGQQANDSQSQESIKKDNELDITANNKYLPLGVYYMNQQDYIKAERAFKKAIELNPKNYEVYIELGLCYKDQGKHGQAEEALKKAIELNPASDKACRELVWFYTYRGEYLQAEEIAKKAIALNPKNDKVYMELGFCYRTQKKYLQAAEVFKKAIELKPRNDVAYFELGGCYKISGKLSQAAEAFRKVIELNPENDRAYMALLVLSEETGDHKYTQRYSAEMNRLKSKQYNPITAHSYQRLKEISDKRGIKLVCIQYPVRSIEPLKRIFQGQDGVIFVDNEKVFKDALKKASYREYFTDMFGGEFGHCTYKGNRLLAENIANVILKEVFDK